jgi:hypothetical protein
MSAKSRWLLQIPDIIDRLGKLHTPVIDRAICEKIFRVKRRRAIALMQGFGGYRTGNTVLIDRAALMEKLHTMLTEPAVEVERQRKRRLSEHLVKLEKHRRAAAVRIPVGPESAHCTMSDLPVDVCFEPGKLIVRFNDVEQLLARLYELAQAAANDFDRFTEASACK